MVHFKLFWHKKVYTEHLEVVKTLIYLTMFIFISMTKIALLLPTRGTLPRDQIKNTYFLNIKFNNNYISYQ